MIAMTFVLLACTVGGKAIHNIRQEEPVTDVEVLIHMAIPAAILLTLLGAGKIYIARCLHSEAMKKDGVCSLAAAKLSLGILVSGLIYQKNPDMWWLDSAFAIGISFTLGIYGGRTLTRHSWWTKEFWSSEFENVAREKRRGSVASIGSQISVSQFPEEFPQETEMV